LPSRDPLAALRARKANPILKDPEESLPIIIYFLYCFKFGQQETTEEDVVIEKDPLAALRARKAVGSLTSIKASGSSNLLFC
jgi:hypothetical protein